MLMLMLATAASGRALSWSELIRKISHLVVSLLISVLSYFPVYISLCLARIILCILRAPLIGLILNFSKIFYYTSFRSPLILCVSLLQYIPLYISLSLSQYISLSLSLSTHSHSLSWFLSFLFTYLDLSPSLFYSLVVYIYNIFSLPKLFLTQPPTTLTPFLQFLSHIYITPFYAILNGKSHPLYN